MEWFGVILGLLVCAAGAFNFRPYLDIPILKLMGRFIGEDGVRALCIVVGRGTAATAALRLSGFTG